MQIKEIKKVDGKLDKTIPTGVSGVYILFDKNLELLYVGRAKNVRSRILAHVKDSNAGRYEVGYDPFTSYNSLLPQGSVKYYSIIEIEDERQRKLTELILVNILKPLFNYCDLPKTTKEYLERKSPDKASNQMNSHKEK